MKKVKNYINGEWVDSKTKEYGDVWCPASGEKIAEVPFSTAEDIDKAVQAAKKAYWEWRCTPPLTRARYFFKLKDLFENAFEDIARTLVTEEGKTLDERAAEVQHHAVAVGAQRQRRERRPHRGGSAQPHAVGYLF